MATVSDYLYVSAVVLRKQSNHKWGKDLWTLDSVVSSQQFVEESRLDNAIVWSDLKLQIYTTHCDSYYQNLLSKEPKIYLVCQQQGLGGLQPHFITVDYDEANAYIETGEEVLIAPLADTLCHWLEQFVLTHYQPEEPKVRRRKQWHDQSEGHVRRVR